MFRKRLDQRQILSNKTLQLSKNKKKRRKSKRNIRGYERMSGMKGCLFQTCSFQFDLTWVSGGNARGDRRRDLKFPSSIQRQNFSQIIYVDFFFFVGNGKCALLGRENPCARMLKISFKKKIIAAAATFDAMYFFPHPFLFFNFFPPFKNVRIRRCWEKNDKKKLDENLIFKR